MGALKNSLWQKFHTLRPIPHRIQNTQIHLHLCCCSRSFKAWVCQRELLSPQQEQEHSISRRSITWLGVLLLGTRQASSQTTFPGLVTLTKDCSSSTITSFLAKVAREFLYHELDWLHWNGSYMYLVGWRLSSAKPTNLQGFQHYGTQKYRFSLEWKKNSSTSNGEPIEQFLSLIHVTEVNALTNTLTQYMSNKNIRTECLWNRFDGAVIAAGRKLIWTLPNT